MSDFYTPTQQQLQDEFNSRELADRLELALAVSALTDHHVDFITQRNMFFLSTVDEFGFPSCSYKGGNHGFVRVLNSKTLLFPNYDGNGMFMSQGNIVAHAKVGLLFIDFEIPQRIRLRGEATLLREGPLVESYPGAITVCEVNIHKVWPNCPRYIHRLEAKELSASVPKSDGSYQLALWKRIDILQDVITDAEREEAEACGLITVAEYAERESRGETTL